MNALHMREINGVPCIFDQYGRKIARVRDVCVWTRMNEPVEATITVILERPPVARNVDVAGGRKLYVHLAGETFPRAAVMAIIDEIKEYMAGGGGTVVIPPMAGGGDATA